MTDRPTFPPAVLEALRKGNKLEAVKLLRQASKPAVGAATRAAPGPPIPGYVPHSKSGLSPGEVPRAGGNSWWVLVLVLGVVAFFVLR